MNEYLRKAARPGQGGWIGSISRDGPAEAGVPTGWERYVGFRGRSVGIDRYGASMPGEELLQELGISPENVANEALDLLGRPERVTEDEGTPAVEDTDPSEGHS